VSGSPGRSPRPRAHLFDDEGHLSLIRTMPEMFAKLRALGDLGPARAASEPG